jgi:hypothetical protein
VIRDDSMRLHAQNVGGIVGNLLSLDFLTRLAIEWLENRRPVIGHSKRARGLRGAPEQTPSPWDRCSNDSTNWFRMLATSST